MIIPDANLLLYTHDAGSPLNFGNYPSQSKVESGLIQPYPPSSFAVSSAA